MASSAGAQAAPQREMFEFAVDAVVKMCALVAAEIERQRHGAGSFEDK
jgi:hypothetical protein